MSKSRLQRSYERDYFPEERAAHWLLSLIERGIDWLVGRVLNSLERYRRQRK